MTTVAAKSTTSRQAWISAYRVIRSTGRGTDLLPILIRAMRVWNGGAK